MGNNSDKFILEISAKIEKDSKTLINELKTELKNVEKESKINLSFDEKKTEAYLKKLKNSINAISSELNNAKLDANSSAFSNFVKVLKEGAEYSKTIADSLERASLLEKTFNKLQKQSSSQKKKSENNKSQQNTQLNKDIVNLDFKDLSKQISQIEKQADKILKNKKFKTKLSSISDMLKNPFKDLSVDFSSDKSVEKYINDMHKRVNSIMLEFNNITRNQISDKKTYISENLGKYDTLVSDNTKSSLEKKLPKYESMVNQLKGLIVRYDNQLKQLGNSTDIAFDVTNIQNTEKEISKLLKTIQSFDDNTVRILPDDMNFEKAKLELKALIKEFAKDNGSDILNFKIDENLNKGILKISANLEHVNGETQKITYSYNDANKAVQKLTVSNQQLLNTTKTTSTFTGSLKDMYKASFAHIGMEDFIQKVREGAQVVRDLDTALTEMNKVSNESFLSLQKYSSATFDKASDIGSTGLDLQNSTADWMRLGKSMQEASKLAEDTNVLLNVSEFSSIDEATSSMVSMTQAYQELSSNDIVDKLNLAGNNYSISTDKLASSLQKSSSALKTAKNNFDEAIALTVAGNSVVQDPDSVAGGIRTIALRMSGTDVAKSELESLGEDTDNFLTKSKLNETLEKLTSIDERGGITLLDDNGNYRSTAQVLIDLADRWDEIGVKDLQDGQNRQNALLEALAGKNRANILASILNDKDLLKTVYEDVSTNYDGSAMEENEKQMESIEGHITELRNKWQEFWASDTNREFVTDLLDLAKGAIELVNALGGAKTVIPLFIAAWSQIKFDAVTNGLTSVVTILREIATFGKSETLLSSLGKLFDFNKNEKLAKWKDIFTQPLQRSKSSTSNKSIDIDTAMSEALKDEKVNIDKDFELVDLGLDEKSKEIKNEIQDTIDDTLNDFELIDLGNKSDKKSNLDIYLTDIEDKIDDINDKSIDFELTDLGNDLDSLDIKFTDIEDKIDIINNKSIDFELVDINGSMERLNKKLTDIPDKIDDINNKSIDFELEELGLNSLDVRLPDIKDKTDEIDENILDVINEVDDLTLTDMVSGKTTTWGGEIVENIADGVSENSNVLKDVSEEVVETTVEEGIKQVGKNGKLKSVIGGLFTNLFTFLKTPLGAGVAIAAIGAGAYALYNKYIEGLEEAAERAENAADNYKNTFDDLSKFKANIPDLAKEYDTLRKGVSSTGENLSLTNEEFSRYNEITNQIASKFPSLISGYNSTGNAIINMKNSLEELNNAYDTEAQKKARESIEESSLKDQKKAIKLMKFKNNDTTKTLYNDLGISTTGISSFIARIGTKDRKESRKDSQKLLKLINSDGNLSEKSSSILDGFSKILNMDLSDDRVKSLSDLKLSDLSKSLSFNENDYNTIKNILQTEIQSGNENAQAWLDYINSSISEYKEQYQIMKSRMVTFTQSKSDYYNLSESSRTTLDSLIMNLSENDYNKYSNEEDLKKLLSRYGEYVSNNSNVITSLSNVEGIYNNEKTLTDAKKKINDLKKETASKLGLSEETIVNNFGLNDDIYDQYLNKITSSFSKVVKLTKIESKKFKQDLSNSFSANELEKISENSSDIYGGYLDLYLNKYKDKFSSFEDFALGIMKQISTNVNNNEYNGINKSFSQINEDSQKYSSTLSELNSLGNDNTTITKEMYDTLSSYGNEFSDYISVNGNDYIIENIQAVKELIQVKQQQLSIDAQVSKNSARSEYIETTDALVDLTNQLEKTCYAEGELDESILKNIYSTQSQLQTIENNIQKYAQLEQQLLGTTNAFDVYNAAVEADAQNNKYSSAKTIMETIKNGLTTGQMGTESFKAAIQGILSDEEFSELMAIDNLDKRVNAMKSKYNSLNRYFKTDDNGNMTMNSIQNFVNDAYKNKLLTSNNLKDFDIEENINLDDFVEKLGYSEEIIYSIFENIQSYNADWGDSLFEGLTDNTEIAKTSAELDEVTEKLEEYSTKKTNALVKRSKTKKGSDEWNKLTEEIEECNKEIDEYQTKQENLTFVSNANVDEYIDIDSNIDEKQKEINVLKASLENETNFKKRIEIGANIDKAEQELGNLLKQKEDLGTPTTIEFNLKKTQIEDDINDLKAEKIEIETTYKQELRLPTAEELKRLDDIDAQIKQKEEDLNVINIQLGIEKNDTYSSTMSQVAADKEEIGKDVPFDVIANTQSAMNNLFQVKNSILGLKNMGDVDVDVTIRKKTVDESDSLGKNNTSNKNKKSSANKLPLLTLQDKMNGLFRGSLVKAFGNAYSTGSNSITYTSGKTLVGEFGAETIVDPWSGRYKVVGIHGSELIDIPKDAIVYNHKQTEQLQKNNKINSRGKLITNASGFMKNFAKASPMQGNAFAYINKTKVSDSASKSLSSSKKSSSSKDSDEIKGVLDDIFDWIEIRLERLSNKTQKWITLAENTLSKSLKQTRYKSAINNTATEISQNQTAYSKYMAYANSIITGAKKSGFKNFGSYAKKVRDGSLNLQSIKNEQLLEFINSYKEMYDKAVSCSDAVADLTGELTSLAESLYNIPIEHAEKKIEKFTDKIDVLSTQIENYNTYQNRNKNLDKQTSYQKSILKAYQTASKEASSNLSSAKSKINSTSDSALKGLTSAQKKSIVNNVKNGNEINIGASYSATAKKAIANYNAALEANRVAANESAKASAEYTKVLRENTNAKYENITAYYEQNRSLNEARLSKLDAQLEYRKAMGYSAVSTHSSGQKAVYDNIISYNNNILSHLRSERSKYNEKTLAKQYEDGKLSREDYYSLLSHAQELDEQIYSTLTAIEEAEDEIYKLNITRLDYIIDGVARAMEKFKNIISLKEARDEDIDESYYVSQNEGLTSQIESLYEKREAILKEMKDQNVESERYQELAAELQNTENDIYSKLIEIEENKNEVEQNRFKKVNDSIDKINTVIDDVEHLRDLLSDDELIDENGVFTDSGLAEIALVGELIDNNTQKITDYRYALEKLEENFTNGNLSPTEYEEQSRAFIEGIQDAVKSIEDYKDVLIDLYSEQLQVENDALKETIENRKEALQAKKSYYDYDKTLKSANKDIVSLKNQIAALEGVGNASAKAEVERLKAQLSEAEENLEDTKYEHLVELRLSGYDEMSASADKILEDLLNDLKTNAQLQEQVVSDMLNNIVGQYETAYGKIKETINSTSVGDNTFSSISETGQDFSTSVNKPANNRETSYGTIETSTIYSGNENTAKIEKALNESTPETDRKINTITPNSPNVSIVAGKSQTVSCKIQPSDAKNQSLTVKTSDSKVATATTSSNSVTIIGKSKGSCKITITAKDGGGATAEIKVSVSAADKPNPDPPKEEPKSNANAGDSKTGSGTGSNSGTDEKKSNAGYISNLSPVITSSSSSTYIKKVQTALNGLGIKGKDGKKLTVDGKWGTNTDYAVKTFQKSSKWGGSITADGKIGPQTKLKFKKAGYYKGGIVDNVITNADFLNMIRMNNDDGLITAKLGEGIIPQSMMPNFTSQLEKFNSIPADKIINSINNTAPSLNIQIDKFMDVQGNVDKNCVNDLRDLQNDITNNITKTLTQEFRKLGYK